MKLIPRAIPFWHCAVSWHTYPFRLVWIGFWMVSYDRSHCFWTRWPHVSIDWNDD